MHCDGNEEHERSEAHIVGPHSEGQSIGLKMTYLAHKNETCSLEGEIGR